MNPDDNMIGGRVTKDWLGRPMHMTPSIYRIMREMSGFPKKPRKGFRQPPRNPKKGKRSA